MHSWFSGFQNKIGITFIIWNRFWIFFNESLFCDSCIPGEADSYLNYYVGAKIITFYIYQNLLIERRVIRIDVLMYWCQQKSSPKADDLFTGVLSWYFLRTACNKLYRCLTKCPLAGVMFEWDRISGPSSFNFCSHLRNIRRFHWDFFNVNYKRCSLSWIL